MAASSACLPSASPQLAVQPIRRGACCFSPAFGSGANSINFHSAYSVRDRQKRRFFRTIQNVATVTVPSLEEIKEFSLPTWAEFELGRAPVFWKTMNGLAPTSGQSLTLFYNPAAKNLAPNDEFGFAFNGGFNQPIMCGGEPRVMTKKNRGKADPPIYTIKICVPKHAVNLIFSFTNGVEWDGPYRLQFEVLKEWRNQPMIFFNKIVVLEAVGRGKFVSSHTLLQYMCARGITICYLDHTGGVWLWQE